MFLSKFLARNNTKTKLELLTEAWIGIQKYYETAAGKKKYINKHSMAEGKNDERNEPVCWITKKKKN